MKATELMLDVLDCAEAYRGATDAERFAICNGCGSAKAKFDFVPDSIYLLNISPACWAHDWDYHHGKTLADKIAADRRFLDNMLTIIELKSNWLMKPIRRWRAMSYYSAVSDKGHSAFWAGKEIPKPQSIESMFDSITG